MSKLLLALGACVAAVGGTTLGWIGVTERDGEQQSGMVSQAYVSPTPGDEATPAAWLPDYLGQSAPHSELTVAEWVEVSPIVARVRVDRVDRLRFNTDSGLMPTPGARGSELILFRPVVLTVLEWLKYDTTPTAEGYVVRDEGGFLDGHEYRTYGGPWFTEGSVGVEGVAFLFPLGSTPGEDDEMPLVAHLFEVLQDLYPSNYEVALLDNYYASYLEGSAVSVRDGSVLVNDQMQRLGWEPRALPIDDFMAELADALD